MRDFAIQRIFQKGNGMAKGDSTALGPRAPEADSGLPDPVEVSVEMHDPNLYRYDAAAEGVEGVEGVTDDHIRFFHDQGYLVVHDALAPAEVAGALQGIGDLIDGSRPDYRGVQLEAMARGKTLTREERHTAVRKLAAFVEYDDRLKALSEHPGILSVLARIMGEPPELFQDMALLKPPGGREKPWHQDNAYFDLAPETTVVGVWIALDEATPENGCLHVIPGSHREGPRYHFRRRDWQICDTDVPVQRDVMVPLKPGGALFWHGLTHHGSPTNRTKMRRRALQFHYRPASSGKIPKEERLAIFGGEMHGAEC